MENNEVKQYELYDKKNDDFITEEELEHIHPDLDHNFPSPPMLKENCIGCGLNNKCVRELLMQHAGTL